MPQMTLEEILEAIRRRRMQPQASPLGETLAPSAVNAPPDDLEYAAQIGKALVPAPSRFSLFSEDGFGGAHPNLARAIEGSIMAAGSAGEGVAGGLQGIAKMMAMRSQQNEEQRAAGAQQMKAGMGVLEWVDKQRQAQQEEYRKAALEPLEMRLKTAQITAAERPPEEFASSPLGIYSQRTGAITQPAPPETPRPNLQSTVRPDKTSSTGFAEYIVALDPTDNLKIVGEQRIGDAPKPSEGPDKTFRQLGSSIQLANSLKSHPAYTDMLDIDTGMQGVEVGLSQQNGFGDIAAINAFQRMVDPGATVREGDVALIQSASSLMSRILTDYPLERLREGDQLPQATREQMKKAARELYTRRAKNYNDIVGSQYKALAKSAGVPFEMIGRDFPSLPGISTIPNSAPSSTPQRPPNVPADAVWDGQYWRK